MKILWIKTDFLHPTTRGGQIRTLEILRRLHPCHEIHYVAFADPEQPENLMRSSEYCSRAYPVRHHVPPKNSLAFAGQLAAGLFSPLPVVVSRYQSPEMRRIISRLRGQHSFDHVVCDFLSPTSNIESLEDCLLFQHNVETVIWERLQEHAGDPFRKFYLGLQAKRMFAYERRVCSTVARVVAVSEPDAALMRSRFGVSHITVIPTGVDVEFFTPSRPSPRVADLVFVGAMDWLANIDGVNYLVREVLPLIRHRRPDCSLVIVGHNPTPEMQKLPRQDPAIRVTGTVPDIRPYLWGSLVSVVPLRVGGGTRLKIYESMAARVPVVSTRTGAEGLECQSSVDIRIADTKEEFAEACLDLLEDASARARIAKTAWELVSSKFSWERVVRCFEDALHLGSQEK